NLLRLRNLVTGDVSAEFRAEVEDMLVDTGKGDDTVAASVVLAGPFPPTDFPVPLGYTFNLGAGLDTFRFDFSNEVANIELVLRVDSGSETDQVSFSA